MVLATKSGVLEAIHGIDQVELDMHHRVTQSWIWSSSDASRLSSSMWLVWVEI
jgi:hypothetical protein